MHNFCVKVRMHRQAFGVPWCTGTMMFFRGLSESEMLALVSCPGLKMLALMSCLGLTLVGEQVTGLGWSRA
eukprot:gene17091-biopygen4862